jgi:hypothetical protein
VWQGSAGDRRPYANLVAQFFRMWREVRLVLLGDQLPAVVRVQRLVRGTRLRLELHRRVPAGLDDEVHAEHHRDDGKRRHQRARSVVTFAASCSIVPRVAASRRPSESRGRRRTWWLPR